MASETDIAWAAGLFEGEGTIGFYDRVGKTGNNLKQTGLQLEMCDKDVVQRYAAIVGTNVTESTRAQKKNPNHRKTYAATIWTRSHIYKTLILFYPYLGKRRKEKAKEVMDFIEGKLNSVS